MAVSQPCQATTPGDEVDHLGRTVWWHHCVGVENHPGVHHCHHGEWSTA